MSKTHFGEVAKKTAEAESKEEMAVHKFSIGGLVERNYYPAFSNERVQSLREFIDSRWDERGMRYEKVSNRLGRMESLCKSAIASGIGDLPEDFFDPAKRVFTCLEPVLSTDGVAKRDPHDTDRIRLCLEQDEKTGDAIFPIPTSPDALLACMADEYKNIRHVEGLMEEADRRAQPFGGVSGKKRTRWIFVSEEQMLYSEEEDSGDEKIDAPLKIQRELSSIKEAIMTDRSDAEVGENLISRDDGRFDVQTKPRLEPSLWDCMKEKIHPTSPPYVYLDEQLLKFVDQWLEEQEGIVTNTRGIVDIFSQPDPNSRNLPHSIAILLYQYFVYAYLAHNNVKFPAKEEAKISEALQGKSYADFPNPYEPYVEILRRGYFPIASSATERVIVMRGVPKPKAPSKQSAKPKLSTTPSEDPGILEKLRMAIQNVTERRSK